MGIFNKDKSNPRDGAGDNKNLVHSIIQEVALDEYLMKQIMLDPEAALKDYNLSDNEFNSVVLGTHAIDLAIKEKLGKITDNNICIIDGHLRGIGTNAHK